MSAIARFFLYKQVFVAGYDKTATPLTLKLEEEGAEIHYEDDTQRIPEPCRDPKSTLVIYTPAVPATHQELNWFREGGFEVQKRAQVLGTLTRSHRGLCVAGTHGKTTTSSMCAHIMHNSHLGCNAFLGGILKNYGTNYLLSRPRPSRHLRHRGGLSGKFPPLHHPHPARRHPAGKHGSENRAPCGR